MQNQPARGLFFIFYPVAGNGFVGARREKIRAWNRAWKKSAIAPSISAIV
jgi:hypothetical protein